MDFDLVNPDKAKETDCTTSGFRGTGNELVFVEGFAVEDGTDAHDVRAREGTVGDADTPLLDLREFAAKIADFRNAQRDEKWKCGVGREAKVNMAVPEARDEIFPPSIERNAVRFWGNGPGRVDGEDAIAADDNVAVFEELASSSVNDLNVSNHELMSCAWLGHHGVSKACKERKDC